MAISVECQDCHRSYKVDDRLAGKKVKCRNCGSLLRVPDGDASDEEATQQCVACGKSYSKIGRVCPHCGFSMRTGQRELVVTDDPVAEQARKNSRWIRQPGSPLLATLDDVIRIILYVALAAGVVRTFVHIGTSPDGFSLQAILPMLVVLGAVAVIVAPMAAFTVNVTVRKMKMPPRDDTYSRMFACMCVPFSLAMIGGWPETVRSGWVAYLGWPLAILLMLYFLRAEITEWLASLAAAVVAVLLSLIVVALAAGAVNDLSNGLYADMLPGGPWKLLASGQSPHPARATQPATLPQTYLAGTEPAPTPASVPTIAATVSTPASVPTVAATVPMSQPAETQVVATATAPVHVVTTRPAEVAPARIVSPFIANVIEDPGFSDAFAVVVPPMPGDWMLALRNVDNNILADRWSLNPLGKKEQYVSPNFPKASPQFALSAKGDAVGILSFLPRRHLEVAATDNKTSPVSVWLDVAANVPQGTTAAAATSLLGVGDPKHFFLRWDMSAQSALQVFTVPVSPPNTFTWRSLAIGPVADNCPPVMAPNGRITAIFGRNNIIFAQNDGVAPPRPFPVSNDASVRLLAMAFSPDSAQIAVYAIIANLPTLTCYQVRNGALVFTALLSQSPMERNASVFPHSILWLPGASYCLINGNDLVDTATGRKFASLGLTSLADAQVVAPSTLALTFKTPTGSHTVLGKLDDAKIRAAQTK
jgi:predicted Zn finger-like uncharacterized protein